MRRLYVQIYLAFVAVGVITLALGGLLGALLFGLPELTPINAAVVVASATAVPDDQLQARIEEASERTGVAITVWDPEGRVLAEVGESLPFGEGTWFRRPRIRGVRLLLDSGRTVGVAEVHTGWARGSWLLWLAGLAGIVAIGCYPIARRITRRLEWVEQGMERWGDGDLGARIPVRGHDEVASVAASFNRATEQVQRLFEAQRRVLASASHELRSPLARLRMALELVADEMARDGWIERAIRDIDELDGTVEDLLSVGRMQALDGPAHPESMALKALLEEEALHVGALVEGPSCTVDGDPRLIRRMVRNLLENARKYGADPILVRIHDDGFSVSDSGPGVSPDLRDRIFEPFYRPDTHDEGRDGGVGLGLHLVREIALHHKGSVTYMEGAGGGAVFRVRLDRVR